MDWVERTLAGVCVLIAALCVALAVGAVTGILPASEPNYCVVNVGGTGKTHGTDYYWTGRAVSESGDVLVTCRNGEAR